MELVEGPTLAERIATGPIPTDEALPIAKQIAEALEYAHERSIIHRDLKPANIKITPEARVKVLDFGLAKALSTEAAAGDSSSSPTLTMRATVAGVIMGTAAYMSPEQARGIAADKRADIWSFGVVLYEMLTGRHLFRGETVSDTLAAVLKTDPDWKALPPTPASIRRLLRRCLERDRKRRLPDIVDAVIEIDEAAAEPEPVPVTAGPKPVSRFLPWIVAALACLALAVGVVVRRPAEDARTLKFSVLPPENGMFGTGGPAVSGPAVSPNGRHLAFAATVDGKQQLWVRELDSLIPRALPGTDGAHHPFWSPDSRYVAFFTNSKLKKVDIAGGPALTLCDALNGRGGSWNQNDVIIFASNLTVPLYRVAAAGVTAAPLTTLDQAAGEVSHRFPWFLPDGRHYLFTVRNTNEEKTAIYVGDLESKDLRRLFAAASNAVYSPPGFVLFMREQTLLAQPFDAAALRTTADPFPIAEQVAYVTPSIQGQFAVSQTGVLAFYTGNVGIHGQLTWVSRDGKPLGTVGPPGIMTLPAISPDGGTVAVTRVDLQSGFNVVWLHDLAHGTDLRFTLGLSDFGPVWSQDGRQILYTSNRAGNWSLWRKPASGTGNAELLYQAPLLAVATDWSRDGRFVIFQTPDPTTGFHIWVLPLSGDRKPYPFLQSPSTELLGKLSPDGRWLAYQSNETGRFEIYVQAFPGKEGKWPVSVKGGTGPIWSRDGKELFYMAADNKLMAVDVKSGARFEHGVSKPLFEVRSPSMFDVSPDAKRFLVVAPLEQAAKPPMTVVVNWHAGVKR
jgi:Tol biopolymer transport system component